MATTKKRVNISLSKELEQQVTALAKRDSVPTATKITELLRQSVELEEDRLLSVVVDKRRQNSTGKRLSHKEVWG
jgi:predicted DNA-binding protein